MACLRHPPSPCARRPRANRFAAEYRYACVLRSHFPFNSARYASRRSHCRAGARARYAGVAAFLATSRTPLVSRSSRCTSSSVAPGRRALSPLDSTEAHSTPTVNGQTGGLVEHQQVVIFFDNWRCGGSRRAGWKAAQPHRPDGPSPEGMRILSCACSRVSGPAPVAVDANLAFADTTR